jgi:RecB family exonuclease
MFEAFSQEDENYLLLELNDLQEAEFKSLSWVLIQSLWALEAPEEIEVVDTEYEINTELNGVQFHGYVDRIDRDDDGLVITDYKTGSTPRLDRFAKDKIEQVTLYSAAVQQELEENVAFARLIFLEKKTKSILGVVPSDARIKHQLKDLKDSWDEIQKSIENDDFPATRQVLCAWCGFLGMCDEGQEEVIERFKAGTLKKTSPAYAAIQDLLQNEVPVQLTVAPRVGP